VEVPLVAAVQDSAELRRIETIIRRVWTPAQISDMVARWTEALRTSSGSQTLFPLQAVSLTEIASWRGLFGALPTGTGKTLLSGLAARAVPGVQRPLLLVPAHLREKTETELREYRRDWVLPGLLRVESYQTLSQVRSERFLQEFKPDLIIADEADYLKNPSAGVTRRVARYLREAHEARKRVPFVALLGSPTDTGLRDFAHLISWAVPQSPVPEEFLALDEWARCLDADVPEHRRLAPGALVRLEPEARDEIRQVFQRRLHHTPGVVLSYEAELPIPIDLRGIVLPLCPAQEAALTELRKSWKTPDGIDVADGPEIWRHAREITTGFYSVWVPRAPQEWKDARSAWARACRETIASNRRGIDTEQALVQAMPRTCDCGRPSAHHSIGDHYPEAQEARAAWIEIEPTFKPNPVPHWISGAALDWIESWARQGPGLIWVDRPVVGEALARRGLPYYSNDGVDKTTGRRVEHHDPQEGSIVLARRANDSGRNLQAWSRNLVVDVPARNRHWQQMIARTHRFGQRAERVTVDVVLGSIEDVRAMAKALDRADYAHSMTGAPTKLHHATWCDIPDPDIEGVWPGARWKRTKPPLTA
jgi:hypothetical protein